MQGSGTQQSVTLMLDFATLEQLRWLREHGGFENDADVVAAGIRVLSRDFEAKDNEQRYREELARQTQMDSYNLG